MCEADDVPACDGCCLCPGCWTLVTPRFPLLTFLSHGLYDRLMMMFVLESWMWRPQPDPRTPETFGFNNASQGNQWCRLVCRQPFCCTTSLLRRQHGCITRLILWKFSFSFNVFFPITFSLNFKKWAWCWSGTSLWGSYSMLQWGA